MVCFEAVRGNVCVGVGGPISLGGVMIERLDLLIIRIRVSDYAQLQRCQCKHLHKTFQHFKGIIRSADSSS